MSRVITLEMLTAEEPIPTLVLRHPAQPARENVSMSSIRQEVTELAQDTQDRIQRTEQALSNVSELSAEEAKRRIQREMRAIREDANRNLDKMENALTSQLDAMTPGQRTEAVAYARETRGFFAKIFDYIANLAKRVVQLIMEGYRLVKEVVQQVFKPILDGLAELWNAFSGLF